MVELEFISELSALLFILEPISDILKKQPEIKHLIKVQPLKSIIFALNKMFDDKRKGLTRRIKNTNTKKKNRERMKTVKDEIIN